ncbi:hypothetical protein Syun_012131 [Stephania yunnanensis]|uniref:Uncharacterized protein n=1 Tax=Stephania yunnanensis TaxID=152371 RepID=A0AAP0JYW1_9MAGN
MERVCSHLENLQDKLEWSTSYMGYLSLGCSTPFLSLEASYVYISLVVDKAVLVAEGEEIDTLKLPPGICPLVFVITGSEKLYFEKS